MLRSTGLINRMSTAQAELLTNHDFTSSIAGWTGIGSTPSWISANLAQYPSDVINVPGYIYQDITTVVGELYVIEVKIKTPTTAVDFSIRAEPVSSSIFDLQTEEQNQITLFGVYKYYFTATTTATRIIAQHNAVTTDSIEVNYISCKLVNASTLNILKDFNINIYDGTQPASADDVPASTLLTTITDVAGVNNVLNFDTDINGTLGAIKKLVGDAWSGTILTNGNLGWGRLYLYGEDPSTSSTTSVRIDFSIGLSGADVNLASVTVEAGGLLTIPTFTYTEKN